MAFRHGKNTKVLFNATDVSGYLNDSSVPESVEVAETTCFGKSAKTYITGHRDATMSLSGLFDGDANASDVLFSTVLGSDTDNNITLGVEGLTHGSRIVTMASIETSYELSSPVADVVSISVEAQGNNAIDRGFSLADLAAVTATGNGTSLDNSASTSNGGAAMLHVTANTMNNDTIFKVQHSADNSTWADLVTFTTVATTATTSERVIVAAGTTVNRYLRATRTCSGTGSITFHINFARR